MTSELVKYRWKADEQSACTKINGLEPAFSPATPIPSLHWEANHPPRPGWFWPLLLLPVGPPPVGQHLWFSECLQLIPLPNSHHYYLHVLKSHPPYTFLWHPRFSFSGQGLLLFSKQGVYPLYLFFFHFSIHDTLASTLTTALKLLKFTDNVNEPFYDMMWPCRNRHCSPHLPPSCLGVYLGPLTSYSTCFFDVHLFPWCQLLFTGW